MPPLGWTIGCWGGGVYGDMYFLTKKFGLFVNETKRFAEKQN